MINTGTSRSDSVPPRPESVAIHFKTSPFWTGNIQLVHPEYSRLHEVYTPNSNKDRHSWKSFQHYKCASASSILMGEIELTSNRWDGSGTHIAYGKTNDPYCFYDGYFGAPGKLNNGLPVFYEPALAHGFIPAPDNLNDWLAMATSAMLPNIKKDLSLLNSVYELKDVRTIGRSLKLYKNTLLSWVSWFKAMGPQFGKMPLYKILRSGADVYLQQKFNVSPLVSDICSTYRALSRAERRMNDLVSRAGRPHISHFSRAFVEYTDMQESLGPYGFGGYNHNYWYTDTSLLGVQWLERTVNYGPSVFHAELDYSYWYSQYQTEHARLLGTLDMLGVNLNPSVVWNAIPWSFVVDWGVGVSRFLDNFRYGFMDPSVCIRRFLWSIKRSRTINVTRKIRFDIDSYGTGGITQGVPLPVVVETSYWRQPASVVWGSLTTSGLSFTEASLAAALAISSRKRHKRRGRN